MSCRATKVYTSDLCTHTHTSTPVLNHVCTEISAGSTARVLPCEITPQAKGATRKGYALHKGVVPTCLACRDMGGIWALGALHAWKRPLQAVRYGSCTCSLASGMAFATVSHQHQRKGTRRNTIVSHTMTHTGLPRALLVVIGEVAHFGLGVAQMALHFSQCRT